MDELMRQIATQAPAVAALMYLIWRLDARLQELQSVLIDLLKSEQTEAHKPKNKD